MDVALADVMRDDNRFALSMSAFMINEPTLRLALKSRFVLARRNHQLNIGRDLYDTIR